MLVKEITEEYYEGLEKGINDLLKIELKNKKIIDIKYCLNQRGYISAFIHYEEE